MRHTPLVHVALAVASAAAVSFAWRASAASPPAPLPRSRVDLPATARPAPISLDAVVAGAAVTEATARIESLRAEVDQRPRIAAPSLTPAAAFRDRYRRRDLDFVDLCLRAPELAAVDQLLRSSSLNPRDVALDGDHVALLGDLLAAHRRRLDEIAAARGSEATRLAFDLAARGEALTVEAAARRLDDDQLAAIDAEALALAAQVPGGAADLAGCRAAARRAALEEMVDADATIVHAGREFFAPKDSLRAALRPYDEFRRFLATEMLGDVVAVFAHAGALADGEASAMCKRYFEAAWPNEGLRR